MAKLIRNVSAARLIRIQLKTGYIKEPPLEYAFLRRFPPIARINEKQVEKVHETKTSLPNLYQKAIEKNVIYADERIYPAYWQQEPLALTLAKRQYQLMKQGVDEETAYVKAMRYVEELESKAYEAAKDLEDILRTKGARVVYASNESLMQELTYWRARLADTRYSNMTLREQGQIDHLIQTKILNWEESERDRRMVDPIFYQQFIKIRSALFPEIASERQLQQLESLQRSRFTFKSELYRKYNVKEPLLSPAAPFYLEDYQNYFEKVKATPNLTTWSEADRSTFFRWIVNTLALREVLKNSATIKVQSYLEDLRNKYFPMIKYPERVYTLPDIEGLKAILYHNDVGYKKQSGKVYVRRFYRLPALLFPEETSEPVPSYRFNQNGVSQGTSAYARNQTVQSIRRELEFKVHERGKTLTLDDLLRDEEESSEETLPSSSPTDSTSKSRSSKVEQLLKNLDLSSDDDAATASSELSTTKTASQVSSTTVESSKPTIQLSQKQIEVFTSHAEGNKDLQTLLGQFNIVEMPKDQQIREENRDIFLQLPKESQREVIYKLLGSQPLVEEANPEEYYPFLLEKIKGKKLEELNQLLKEVHILGRLSTSEERQLLVEQYNPSDKTLLEIEREKFFQEFTRTSYDYCVTQEDYDKIYNARQQFLIMEKAQIAVQYEQRESARLTAEWKSRGLVPTQPVNLLPLVTNND